MIFEKRKILAFAILAGTILLATSCNSRHIEYQRAMLPYNSFTKIETRISVHLCLEVEEKQECRNTYGRGSGSGTIIKHRNDNTYVLTAGHVCDSEQQREFWEQRGGTVTISSIAIDFLGARYPIDDVVLLEETFDLCILRIKGIVGQVSPIGVVAPRIGDHVFNIAAPQGDQAPGMAAILEGRFSGLFQFETDNKRKSAYTIPAIGGSSGSGVFNTKGQLIGMIHSVRRNFHHLSYGPMHDELIHFIKTFEDTLVHFSE